MSGRLAGTVLFRPAPPANSCGLPVSPDVAARLAFVAIVIRMVVAPIPVRSLLFHLEFGKGTILSVAFSEIDSEGMVFAIIPIVKVLVLTIVNPPLILIVSVVFFLASIILRRGRRPNCYRRS